MSTDPEELEFGNFKILRRENGDLWELGRGGFGTTYKAEHKHLMRACALKVINDNRVASEDARRRFLQEARAAASLLHPHIAAIYDFGESDGTFYYAMEYCSGGDLDQYATDKGALLWAEVEPLALQMASALSLAHQSGLLHRDLKPSNVMLSSGEHEVPQLKLIDFGLVKVLDHLQTSSTQIMMTQEGAAGFNPLTASPEQLRDEDLDERSDLFSFGVTLLYLLRGGIPFGKLSAPLMMAQRLDDKSYDDLLPEDLTGVGREVVSCLLEKDREKRYRSAEDVLDAMRSGSSSPLESTVESAPSAGTPLDVADPIVSIADAIEGEAEQEMDWEKVWDVDQLFQQFHFGSYYRCVARHEGIQDVVMFMPNTASTQIESIIISADKLWESGSSMLLSFALSGKMGGERAYLCQPFLGEGGKLLQLLQAQGSFTLQTHTEVFWQIAKAIDEAIEVGIPGLELNPSLILINTENLCGENTPSSSDEWVEYFNHEISENADYSEDVKLTLFPKLEEAVDNEDIQATVTPEDLATDPLVKFGTILYRAISGMAVRPAAYLRAGGYVSTSNLGEESNRFLADLISGQSDVTSATEILEVLCEYEGVSWDAEALEHHLLSRQDESRALSDQLTDIEGLLQVAVAAEKNRAEEEEKRQIQEAKVEAAAQRKREREEAKKRKEQEALDAEKEARKKREDKERHQKQLAKEKTQKEAQEKAKVKAEVAAKKKQKIEEKRKQKEQEALDLEKEESKKREDKARRQKQLLKEQAAKEKAQKKAKEEKQEEVQKQAPVTSAAGQNNAKSDTKAGRSQGSKKKLLVAGILSLIVLLLAAAAFVIYSQDDKGKKRRSAKKSSSSSDRSVDVGESVSPTITQPIAGDGKVTLQIPLANGGKGVPDDAELVLVSGDDGSVYGELIKDGALLRTSDVVSKPSSDESYKIQLKNKIPYTMVSEVTLKGGRFSAGEEGFLSYRSIDLNVHAQINFSPKLMHGEESLDTYKNNLLKQLNSHESKKIIDAKGGEIKGAKVSYKEDSGQVQITLPAGWSLKKNPVRLIVNWPMINPIDVNIFASGVENKLWQITPKIHELDLTSLKEKMPRFDKVEFIPNFKKQAGGLADLYRRIQSQAGKKLILTYEDLLKEKPLIISSSHGDLIISGGVVHFDGVKLPGAVERHQLSGNVPHFPSGFYYGSVSVPYRQAGTTEVKTVPGLASINLDDLSIRGDGAKFAYFNLVIEIKNNWKRWLGMLKVTGWDESTRKWKLSVPTGQVGSELNLILEIKESEGGQVLPVSYAEILGKKEQNTVRGEDAEKRGLEIQLQGSTVLAKITMNLMWEKNVGSYMKGVNVEFDDAKERFKRLCKSYVLPPGYPALTPETLKMLSEKGK